MDFDLSVANLPVGSHLSAGTAIIEVSDKQHMGCKRFSARFGIEALRWMSSPTGQALRMRGMNARVVKGGIVRPGDSIRKVRDSRDVFA